MDCPQCKAPMLPSPAPDKRKLVKQMVDAGSSAAYATNFVDNHLEKEAELGVVYTCANCRYVTREKAEEPKRRARKDGE